MTRIALGLTLTTLLATTAMAQKISTESAPGTNFGGYKTFMWVKQPTSPTRCSGSASSTTSTRSSRRRDSGVVTEGADLGVAAHMATRQEKSLNTFYDGFGGGWRWGGGFGTATTTVDTYEEGTLIVDMFDAKTKQTIWRGTATQRVSTDLQKQAANMAKAAHKLFKKFPA